MKAQGWFRQRPLSQFHHFFSEGSVGVRQPRHFLGVPFSRSQIAFILRFESAAS